MLENPPRGHVINDNSVSSDSDTHPIQTFGGEVTNFFELFSELSGGV